MTGDDKSDRMRKPLRQGTAQVTDDQPLSLDSYRADGCTECQHGTNCNAAIDEAIERGRISILQSTNDEATTVVSVKLTETLHCCSFRKDSAGNSNHLSKGRQSRDRAAANRHVGTSRKYVVIMFEFGAAYANQVKRTLSSSFL